MSLGMTLFDASWQQLARFLKDGIRAASANPRNEPILRDWMLGQTP